MDLISSYDIIVYRYTYLYQYLTLYDLYQSCVQNVFISVVIYV